MDSVAPASRDFAAIVGKLGIDLLDEPDIHRGRVVLVPGIVQIVSKALTGLQGAVEAQELEQIDDGLLVVQRLASLGGQFLQNGIHIHLCDGRSRSTGSWLCRIRRLGRRAEQARGEAGNLGNDVVEKTHDMFLP